MSDGHWPPDVTVSRCRPQRWHQESPTMALNLKEDPVVMAPGNAISFWNILFFSDCSFPAYWKFQEQWALSAGNHPPWCQETQHSQSWADNQSSHGLYKAAWLCMPFGPRFFFSIVSTVKTEWGSHWICSFRCDHTGKVFSFFCCHLFLWLELQGSG